MRGRLLIAAVLVGALAAPPGAEARSFVLKAKGSKTGLGTVRVGDFRPARDPLLGAAVDAFGATTSRRGGGDVCRVRWNPLGLRMRFQNFGGLDSCDNDGGRAQKGVIRGDSRWRTPQGLRIGNTVARLRRLHPKAKRTARGFRLVQGRLPFGTPRVNYSVLGVRVAGGRVTAFTFFIGAAGD